MRLEKPARVLLVAPSMDMVGGQSIQANHIRQRMRDEPSLRMFFQPIDPKLSLLRMMQDVKYVRTLVTFPLYCGQLTKAILRCDIVHVFSASYLSFMLAPAPAILIARQLGKPVIVNYHSGEAEDHLVRWPSAIRLLSYANRIAVPSGFLLRVFQRFGLSADVIPNFVDLGAFEFRERANPKPRYLANRNFESHYNVACVLRAFSLIQQELPDACLSVAGDGPERSSLHQLAADLKLRNIKFLGVVRPDHMPAIYDAHDVWLNASDVDNMPLSIIEAYASGLAVVTSDAGGIPDIVVDGRTGFLVAAGNPSALAARAIEVVSKPQLFADLTKRGRVECEKYTWEAVRANWLTLYSELALEASTLT